MNNAVLVFAKIPAPGRVKTRLTRSLTPAEAAYLYEAFLRDALDQYRTLNADIRLYFSPTNEAIPQNLVPDDVSVHYQQGASLGPRMQRAFVESFAVGYERLVIIGTDHPTLPTAFIEFAFEALAKPLSICLGPSEDGGYYLLGMNDFFPTLFLNEYSHDTVFDQTLERALETGASLTILPSWYDVDTPESLLRLAQDLADPDVAASHTRRVMDELRWLPGK